MPGCQPTTKAKTRRTNSTSSAPLPRNTALYKVYTEEVLGGKANRAQFKQLLLEACQKKFDLYSGAWTASAGKGLCPRSST